MDGKQRLRDALNQRFDARTWRPAGTAYLTRGDGNGTLIFDEDKRLVWLHRTDASTPFYAYLPPLSSVPLLDGDTSIETYEVRLGYPEDSNVLTVRDTLSAGGMASAGGYSPMEAVINAAQYPPVSQFRTLNARSTDTPSTSITVDGPYLYTKPSTGALVDFGSQQSASFSAEIAALTSGQHQCGWICLNVETNALVGVFATAATATNTVGTTEARGEFTNTNFTAISIAATYKRIDPIYLYYGQTTIEEADFYRDSDARLDYPVGSAYVPRSGGTMTGNIDLNDNALLRATYTDYKIAAAPANPSAGYGRLYLDTADSHLKWRSSAGAITDLNDAPWATPGTIGSTTPNTGAFTSLSAGSGVWASDTSGIITHTPGSVWAGGDTDSTYLYTATASDVQMDTQGSGTTAYTLATKYVAVKFVPTSSYTMRRVTCWLKGLSGTTSTITAKLYSDSAGSPNTLLATGTLYRHGSLTGSFVEYSFGLGAAVVSGTAYWLVLDSSALSAADVYTNTTAVTGEFATSTDGSSWSLVNDKRLRYVVFAGRRRGISITSYNNMAVYANSINYYGVYGSSSNSIGVGGISTNYIGIYGVSANYIGVYGTSTNSYGVYGNSTNNVGTAGVSTGNYGVYGNSTNNVGVYGISTNSVAVYAYRNTASPSSAVSVLYAYQDHASDTNTAALIRQDGTGDILRLSNGADATVRWSCTAAGVVTGIAYDAATSAPTDALIVGHNSSDTPAAGFGTGIALQGQSSTTANRAMGAIRALWETATDASRVSDLVFYANYTTTEREVIRIRGGSSAAALGFFGVTPVAQQALGSWAGLTTDQKLDALRDALSNLGLASYS